MRMAWVRGGERQPAVSCENAMGAKVVSVHWLGSADMLANIDSGERRCAVICRCFMGMLARRKVCGVSGGTDFESEEGVGRMRYRSIAKTIILRMLR